LICAIKICIRGHDFCFYLFDHSGPSTITTSCSETTFHQTNKRHSLGPWAGRHSTADNPIKQQAHYLQLPASRSQGAQDSHMQAQKLEEHDIDHGSTNFGKQKNPHSSTIYNLTASLSRNQPQHPWVPTHTAFTDETM